MYCPLCGEAVENDQFNEHMAANHTAEEFHSIMSPPQPSIQRIVRGENFYKIYATRFEIMETQYDFRIDVLNERRTLPQTLEHPEIIEFISESQLIMPPLIAKRLHRSLSEVLARYEAHHGVLDSGPEAGE